MPWIAKRNSAPGAYLICKAKIPLRRCFRKMADICFQRSIGKGKKEPVLEDNGAANDEATLREEEGESKNMLGQR